MNGTISLSSKARRTPESPISHFMELALHNPHLISLAAGLVDAPSLPASPVSDAVATLLNDPATARAALQYGTTQGHRPLLEEIVRHVSALDGKSPEQMKLSTRDCLVTTGSQQLLYMLSELLFDPGDIAITESPSYFVYHSVLAGNGARVLAVPMDDEGMIVDELDELLARLEREGDLHRVKLIYTVDYFQNPTGLTLSAERRVQLMNVVRKYSHSHRILVLEDAAYRELRYEGEDVPSLKSLDPEGQHVVYAGTFSKPLAPGLKTGYALLPAGLMPHLVRMKGNHDFGSNNLSQHVVYEMIRTGAYARHVQKLRDVYRHKRNTMLEALEENFRDWPEVRWTHPKGGMFVWITFPEPLTTSQNGELLKAALDEGVLFIPGEFGHVSETGDIPRNEARLSFGDSQPEQIREGARRLRRAADRAMSKLAVHAS